MRSTRSIAVTLAPLLIMFATAAGADDYPSAFGVDSERALAVSVGVSTKLYTTGHHWSVALEGSLPGYVRAND